MPTPESTPNPNPKARKIRLEKVGTYTVGELGGGQYIILDDTFSNCYLVEASSPTEAVEVADRDLEREGGIPQQAIPQATSTSGAAWSAFLRCCATLSPASVSLSA